MLALYEHMIYTASIRSKRFWEKLNEKTNLLVAGTMLLVSFFTPFVNGVATHAAEPEPTVEPAYIANGAVRYPTIEDACQNGDALLCAFDADTNVQFTKTIKPVAGRPGQVDVTLEAKGPVVPIPEDVYVSIVFDESSSMDDSSYNAARDGVLGFIDGLRASEKIGDVNLWLTKFGTGSAAAVNITGETRNQIRGRFNSNNTNGQATNLDRGLVNAYAALSGAPADAAKYIVVLSDGVPTACIGTSSWFGRNDCEHEDSSDARASTNSNVNMQGSSTDSIYHRAAANTAATISRNGVKIVTVAYQTSTTDLSFLEEEIASDASMAFTAAAGDVVAKLTELAGQITLEAGENAVATDVIADGFTFVRSVSGGASNSGKNVVCNLGVIDGNGVSCTFRLQAEGEPDCITPRIDQWMKTNSEAGLSFGAYYEKVGSEYRKLDTPVSHSGVIADSPEFHYVNELSSDEQDKCHDVGVMTIEKRVEMDFGEYGDLYDAADYAVGETFEFSVDLGTDNSLVSVTKCVLADGSACGFVQNGQIVTLSLKDGQKATLTVFGTDLTDGVTVSEQKPADGEFYRHAEIIYNGDESKDTLGWGSATVPEFVIENLYDAVCATDLELLAEDPACYYVPGTLTISKNVRDDTGLTFPGHGFGIGAGASLATDEFLFAINNGDSIFVLRDEDSCEMAAGGECEFRGGKLVLLAGETAVISLYDTVGLGLLTVTEETLAGNFVDRDYTYRLDIENPEYLGPEVEHEGDNWEFTNPFEFMVCEWDESLLASDEGCMPPAVCEWDESLLAEDDACVPPEMCEWDESLLADDEGCVPPEEPCVDGCGELPPEILTPRTGFGTIKTVGGMTGSGDGGSLSIVPVLILGFLGGVAVVWRRRVAKAEK